MKETLNYLNKDRKVNAKFMDKLEKVGLEIKYGRYSYWDGQEYVQIGRTKVWLVCEKIISNSSCCDYRYQNNVIKDIEETIRDEKIRAEKSDQQVNEFFEKLGLQE